MTSEDVYITLSMDLWIAVDFDDDDAYLIGAYPEIDNLIDFMKSTGNYKDIELEVTPNLFDYVAYRCSYININAGVRRSFRVMKVKAGKTYFLSQDEH